MITIENLYYTLHRYLLLPLGIQDLMYREFGSTDFRHLVMGRYFSNQNRHGLAKWKTPSCYYCDQEPLTDLVVHQVPFLDSYHWVFKILANSEHSDLKRQLLKQTKYHDWYFFFHGFAALDWFADAKYFDQNLNWSKPFISLNRLHVNDRSYRLNLVAQMADLKILDQGHVSLHLHDTQYGTVERELNDPFSKLSDNAKRLIKKHIHTPLYLDSPDAGGNLSAALGHKEFELWKAGLWHIVTETVFYHNKLHLTEKIFKPIVAQRPFILVGAPGNLQYLKSYGFKTFDRWIDESYDQIQDPDLRIQAIVNELKKICNLDASQLKQMHHDMLPVLTYNCNHFFTTFKTKIVNELVDNFEGCTRLWNNGRVDDKVLPIENINFMQVKQILSQ